MREAQGTGGHGRAQEAMGGHMRPWAGTGGHGRAQEAMGGHRRPWAGTEGHGPQEVRHALRAVREAIVT